MNADRIQGWSRSLIFIGLIFIGSVLASVFATTVANLFFGGAVTLLPGAGMPMDTKRLFRFVPMLFEFEYQ